MEITRKRRMMFLQKSLRYKYWTVAVMDERKSLTVCFWLNPYVCLLKRGTDGGYLIM